MRVVFGTHQLEARAGSELFTVELAKALRARGHDTAIFTFFKGEIAAEVEGDGIPVFEPKDAPAIASFRPDVVQTNHSPCAHFMRAVVPECIRLHAMLGVIPHLETPPTDGRAFSLALAVSEEVLAQASRSTFARDVDVVLFRNWFDDGAVATALPRPDGTRHRVAVISHHIAPELIKALDALEEAGKVSADYFGSQRTPVRVNGEFLTQYDAVISIGRTPLLAAACGVPCIMADIHGSDGLLTVENLDAVRTRNFSGRLTRTGITSAHLAQELYRTATYDREALRGRVVREYALSNRVDWLLSRYDALIAERASGNATPRDVVAPGEGLVYAELTEVVQRLTHERDKALDELNSLKQSRMLRAGRFLRRMTGKRYEDAERGGPEI